ncbi:MAG TPA: hypothetical protein VFJ51_05275 [Nitrososphaeraceae archaeon]|nr:hypothetical protein [Nitrososphaeraceae archaeon]
MDGYAFKVWLLQNSLGTAQEAEYYYMCMEKYYELPSIAWLYFWIDNKHRLLIYIDSSTVAAKKRGKK